MQLLPMARVDRPEIDRSDRASPYSPPTRKHTIALSDLLAIAGRSVDDAQFDLLKNGQTSSARDQLVYYAGNPDLLRAPAVSIVGTRDVSSDGWRRASRLAKELVASRVTIVSGLAKGVDTAALSTAIAEGGNTIAVIGTPLDKASPVANAALQEEIYQKHLLISPFAEGLPIFKSNFPERNRVMAAISDATVIVEASDTSGTLHQASQCTKLGRWLFILKSVAENPNVSWPTRFLGNPKTAIIGSTDDILSKIFQR
jgi:DNA processing protein